MSESISIAWDCIFDLTHKDLTDEQQAAKFRDLYAVLKQHFDPPVLGVSVAETVTTKDKAG